MAVALSWVFWVLVAGVGVVYLARAVVVGERLPPTGELRGAARLGAAAGTVARELALAVVATALWPIGIAPVRLFSQRGRGEPVLLVPGAAMTWALCLPLRWWLRARTDRPVVQLSHRPLFGPPARTAAELARRVRTLAAVSDGQTVHAIGFGEGGTALLLALRDEPELPLGRVVTVGSPTRPPRIGSVFLPGGSSRYAALTDEARGPLPAPALAIRSEGDALVMADESWPAGAGEEAERGEVLSLDAAGHLALWFGPAVWRAALDALALDDGHAQAERDG